MPIINTGPALLRGAATKCTMRILLILATALIAFGTAWGTPLGTVAGRGIQFSGFLSSSLGIPGGTSGLNPAQPAQDGLQTGKFAHKEGTGSGPLDAKPISRDEFSDVFLKVETAVQRVILKSKKTPARVAGGSSAAKTDAIASEMGRVFTLCKGKFKFTPPMISYDKKLLSLKAGTAARKQLEILIKWGFVGKVSPLATSGSQTLTPHEFGDAVGLFLARLAELTHTPSSEWSPYMNWQKEG